jgi:hypothetical protein
MQKELLVNHAEFLDWYFDYDVRKTFFIDNSIYDCLKNDGKFSITTQDLLNNCPYLPLSVLIEGQNNVIFVSDTNEVFTDEYESLILVKI